MATQSGRLLVLSSKYVRRFECLFSLLNDRLYIDLGVFLFFVGSGLLKHRLSAYRWAMFFTWTGLILLPIAAVVFLSNPGDLKLFGQVVIGPAPPGFGFVVAILMTLIVYWQYTVLTSQRVKKLFNKS